MKTETQNLIAVNRRARAPARLRCSVGACLFGAAALCIAFGDGAADPRRAIDAGNTHFSAGRFKEARETYDAATEPAEPRLLADLLHNRAAAAFKLGDYAAARDSWVRAAGLADAAFEGLVQYNLGNCSYREALDQLQAAEEQAVPDATGALPAGATPEPKQVPAQQIIGLLDRAIERYRDAIRLDATLVDARANIELADQLRKKLKEQATSQPDSQPQSQSGSQPSSQQSGQGDQQQNSSQPSSNPSSRPQSQPSSQQSGETGDQQNENGQQQEQDQPQPQEDPSDSQPASRPQSRPAPQTQPMPETQPAESQPSAGEEEGIERMSRAEFERLLQRVRDAEKLRRQKLRAAEAARQKPVDKDW